MEYTPVTVDVLSSFEGWNESFRRQPGRNISIFSFDYMPDTDYHTLADMGSWNVFISIFCPMPLSLHRKTGKITVRLSSP